MKFNDYSQGVIHPVIVQNSALRAAFVSRNTEPL